ncbi:MAG: LytR/AlgR family response regulator transcription factor [Jejuia sp.]
MNCIIIDDEATARVITAKLCSNIPNLNIVEEFSNAIEAIKYLNQNEVDLIFSDIHMPDFTGFDFIETLKNPPSVILTTSDSNLALNAFEYDCIVDYLVKPIELPRLEKAIRKVESLKSTVSTSPVVESALENHLYINIDRRLIKIDIPSICLVEAKGDYINLKTETEDYRVHSSLKKIEDKLPNNLFLKVHRSYIINLKKIIDIEDNSVLIKKDVIPVSRANRADLMNRLNLL